MLPQDHAYEYSAAEEEPRCVLAGTQMKVGPASVAKEAEKKSVFCLRTCLGVEEKTEEVCEVNLRGEWPHLAGSFSSCE